MKYVIDGSTLENLAAAIRSVTGEIRTYTPDEMIEAVTTIMETGTYILVDEAGNEYPAVFLENEQVFTATANDIRAGYTAVTESGVTEGTKDIPEYYVDEGIRVVTAGSDFILPSKLYDYTKLQAVFCVFNTNMAKSVYTDKVAINDSVYTVKSTNAVSEIIKNSANKLVDFGITNSSSNGYLIRYFMYKEMY